MNARGLAGLEEGQTRCPKCGGKNVLIIGKSGDQTICCLDCDYAAGVGIE
ncbi:MAG: hypothetical protein KGI33_09975 [Thaumarchaeota archaeon]|nr:hypothetical protein [Nitrososphaerota archaeon]